MKPKQVLLLLFVATCTLLVVAAMVVGLSEARDVAGTGTEQPYRFSIAATPTARPIATSESSEPVLPAQFDEGAPEPTATEAPDSGS